MHHVFGVVLVAQQPTRQVVSRVKMRHHRLFEAQQRLGVGGGKVGMQIDSSGDASDPRLRDFRHMKPRHQQRQLLIVSAVRSAGNVLASLHFWQAATL